MIEYRLADFQRRAAPYIKYAMGASAPEPVSSSNLLRLADDDLRKQWQDFSLGYTDSMGDAALRQLISEQYPGLSGDNIIVFSGAQEAIYALNHVLLCALDKVQVITPLFEPLKLVPEMIGAQVSTVPMQIVDDRWQLDVDQWISRLPHDAKLATVNFPHNPTGAMISRLQQEMMVEHCRSQGTWLFSDEVFRGLEHDLVSQLPAVAGLYEKGVSLGVMSKAYGLGGVRIGWLATQDRQLISRLLEFKQFLSICPGRADELLAMIALQNRQLMLDNNLQLIQQNLQKLQQVFGELKEHIRWLQPQAGCSAYPAFVCATDSREKAWDLLEQSGVMVVPGYCFLQGKAHFRVGFGRIDFDRALGVFASSLR